MTIPLLTCQEAAPVAGVYLPCGKLAQCVVHSDRDGRAYLMCDACGVHNVKNRGFRLVAAWPHPESGKPAAVEQLRSPEEVGDVVKRAVGAAIAPGSARAVGAAIAAGSSSLRVGKFEGEPTARLVFAGLSFEIGATLLRHIFHGAACDIASPTWRAPVEQLRDLVDLWVVAQPSTATEAEQQQQLARFHATGCGAVFDKIPELLDAVELEREPTEEEADAAGGFADVDGEEAAEAERSAP